MALFGLCFRESYRELMNLASHINPDVKFIDHSEERDKDPEARKDERRRAASVAFKQIFGRKCHWFMEQQEDITIKKEESELEKMEFQQGQIDDETFQMDLNSSMHPEGEKTAPAVQPDRVCTKRESSATPTQKGRSNLQLEELATSGGYPSVPKKERDERVFPSTTDTTGRPRGDQLEPNRSFYSNKLNSILPSFHNQGSLSVFSTNAQSNFSCPCFSAVPEATHKAS